MKTALMGIGNIVLTDEGVGVHVVNAIKERYRFTPEIEMLDGGTMGLDLLHIFDDHDRLMLVDAVDYDKEPGYIRVIRNDEIPQAIHHKFSVHHIGLNDLMAVAKLTDKLPAEVCLVGVQPASIEPGLEMTDIIQSRFEAVVTTVLGALGEWGIAATARE